MTTRTLLWITSIAVVGLLGLLIFKVASSTHGRTTIDQTLKAGEKPKAPNFKLSAIEGNEIHQLADYRGKIVVLNLWASWCHQCIDELHHLQTAHRLLQRGDQGTVIGIDTRDHHDDALKMIRQRKLSYLNLSDKTGEVARSYEMTGIPETFVIDRAGKIVALQRGPVDELWLEHTLEPLLRQRST